MSRPTIDDVALHSGYSVATVSRAIRGLPNVSPATRERVLESAQTLRYQPDANAAGLATGKTGIVAMAVMAMSSWYTSQVMAGAEAELSASGLDLSVMLLSEAALKRARSDHRSISRRSDGLILLDFVPDSGDPDPTFPTVVVGEHSQVFDSVAIDNVAGGRMAGQHLLQRGHRRLAVIAGSREELSQVGAERLNGFLQIAEQFGLDSGAVPKEYGNYSALGGYEAMSTLLSLPDEVRPTAVFALSDDMAIGALRAAKDLEVRVPEDISLVGFDDHELAFGFGLTTVAQEPGTLGAVGAKMLLDRFEGMTKPPRSVECPIKLVVRSSTRNFDA